MNEIDTDSIGDRSNTIHFQETQQKPLDAFHNEIASLELSTDELINIHRSRTDDAKILARNLVDVAKSSRKLQKRQSRSTGEANENSTTSERLQIDSILKIEREFVDSAISKEREHHRKVEHDKRKFEEIQVNSDALKISQERLKHQETLEALESGNEFLAIVSHDLRGPLGAITTSAEMLLEDDLFDTAEVREWIGLVKRSAASMLRLVKDLLDLERVKSGNLELDCTSQSISSLISLAIEPFYIPAATKNIKIIYQSLHPDIPVTCDPDRIAQVISNLIGNAVKFTPENGSITIKVKTKNPTEIIVSVEDTGCGVREDQRKIIFDRYSKIKGNKLNHEGMGLGLYISKWIVEAHKGSIWVESAGKVGAAFYFSLPIKMQ